MPSHPPEPQIQFRPGSSLAPELAKRGTNPNEIAKRDLLRYYTLMYDELGASGLTAREWYYLREAWDGHPITPNNYQSSWPHIRQSEAFENRWNVKRWLVIEKLRELSPCALMAVWDLLERSPESMVKEGVDTC